MEDWIKEHFWNFIVIPLIGAWFALTKWTVNKIFSSYERRVEIAEKRIDDLKHEIDDTETALARKIEHQGERIDQHYQTIDKKIDMIFSELIKSNARNNLEG